MPRQAESSGKRTILVVGMGTSPAVLTNAVWALAHAPKPVVPDEVVVLITKNGKGMLKRELIENGVWNEMLAELKREKIDIAGRLVFGETSIRSIPDACGNELDDLRTGEDNLRAADFMLSQLRQYTEDSGIELHVSIAGGRKSMSALLFSCMTLLGREQDKVYHVLLPTELEKGVEPTFYFPKPGTSYVARRDGKKYSAKKLQCELFEVPFVRMRGWYQEKFKSIPPSYRTLISKVQTVAPPAVAYPEIEIDAWNGWVTLNGKQVAMSRPCFAMLLLLASGVETKEHHRRLLEARKTKNTAACDWLASFQEGSLFSNADDIEDVYKTMSNLRNKFKQAGFDNVEALVPQRGRAVMFPISRIKWRNVSKLVDICGCLFVTKER